MAITRSGDTPTYLQYVTRCALLPRVSTPTTEFQRLTEYHFTWVEIPNYQRGLVWDDEKFEEFLNSPSIFLGNAIFGKFRIPDRKAPFDKLPPSATDYEVLVDGLQRFSIGTALLNILHLLVFTDPPTEPVAAPHFISLKTNALPAASIYQLNDAELRGHPRKAVQDSYVSFRNTLAEWISREIRANPASLGQRIQRLFLGRQVAPDSYNGFNSVNEIANTFIGLNTIRVQLNIVDWLRSLIIERGSQARWSATQIEDVENKFTATFAAANGIDPEHELMPFAAILKDALVSSDPKINECVFPSWNSGLKPSEVEDLLGFVDTVFDSRASKYLAELRLCGAIPFAACLCYYYRQFVAARAMPSFVSGGTAEDDELHGFLRANYRVLFDNRIGRTRGIAEKLLRQKTFSLTDAADEISRSFLAIDLQTPVDRNWLIAALKKTDAKRACRVFNACLLPTRGSSFKPQEYGKNSSHYQIDHLIPDSIIDRHQPGGAEAQTIANFAPIRRTANNRQTNLACSQKLDKSGSYENELNLDKDVHPFVDWLVKHQRAYYSQLDNQEFLQPAATPRIAGERIDWIANRLVPLL
ncbi:MAG TPA: DUF262 domain-containing protein [Bryobacteraceae bacterium]|nr:DUF262 domain-containing protein [Bryobacteraceae bacterium]